MDVKQAAWIEGFVYVTQWQDSRTRDDHMDIYLDDCPVSALDIAHAILEADEGNVIEVVYFEDPKPFIRIIDLQAGENFMTADARIDELMSGGTSMRSGKKYGR